MAIKNNKISAILEEQIPDFIREDHDNFVQFLKSYYEFLESESPPTTLPLVVINPFPTIYKPNNNPYGGQFQIGETIQQKANSDDSTEVTASAKVFAWSGDATAQTAIITSFGGTSKTFIKDVEIVGVKSGVKFFPVNKTESLKAGSTRASLDLLGTKDIDETLDDYVQYIKNEFAVNLPLTLHRDADTRKVLKNIRDFYKARGTENSFKFLFRLLYGEDSSIYLPETDMLRASDANWKNVVVIRVNLPVTGISSDFVGRKIKGGVSLATAVVEKALEILYVGVRFVELELSNKLGTFVAGEFINTDNVGDGTTVRAEVLGLVNNVKIIDSGSNYHVGDRVVVNSTNDDAKGAVAEVLTTNATSGGITSMKIVDPGYSYTSVPILDMTAPHNADAGAARFAAGPLETIFYNDFSQYTGANSFFTESDNRGASSNVGPSTNHPYDDLAYTEFRGVLNPADVTANSIMNFVTIPGVDEGLKGYWKMNSYYHKDATISTADATANDSNDPVANNTFKGPRVGDITFVANPNYDTLSDVQLSYVNHTYTNAMAVPDRTGANTYLSTGWTGFQPIVRDESGQGHHARVASWRGTTPNLITDGYQDFSKKPESLYVIGPHSSLTEDTPDLYPIAQYGSTPEASINTSFSYVGTSSLEYKITVGGASYMTFANALPVIGSYEFRDDAEGVWNGSWVAEIPKGKKWIFSYYAYSDSNIVPEDVQSWVFVRNMEDLQANVAFYKHTTIFSAPRQWERFEMILDFTLTDQPNNNHRITGDGIGTINSQYSHGGLTVTGNDLKANEIDSVILNVGSSSAGLHTRSVGNTVLYDGFSLQDYDEFRPTINPRFETAFANAGIFGAGSTSIGTLAEGGLVLMPHDDISSANTQTWSFWFNPSEKSTGTMTDQIGSGSEMIVSRDTVGHWSWSMNAYTSSAVTTGDYIDTLFSFPNAKFDNGNHVGYYQKLANSAGYYPGADTGLDAQVCYSNDDESDVYTETVDEMTVITIDGSLGHDQSFGAAWKAFNVEDGIERTFSITKKVSGSDAGTGYYVRIYEYNGDLPADKFYISLNGAEGLPHGPDVQVSTSTTTSGVSGGNFNNITNGPVLTTWTTNDFTYIPSASAKWASVNVINWTGIVNKKLYVQPIRIRGGSSGLHFPEGGGTVRADTWNMFTLTIDYTNLVANVYIFNTTDGLLLANGFTLDSRFSPGTLSSPNIVPMGLTGQAPSSAYTHGPISGGNEPRLTTHAMHVQARPQTGDPQWHTGSSIAAINDELQSATAGTGNTARAEVIRDTPGANSYVTGNAFRTYNSNVATTTTAPDGKMPNYIWTYLMGGSTTGAQNNKLREIDDPLGTPNDGVSPYLMEIPKGKRWIFSYYVKSSVVKGTGIGPVSASTGKAPTSDYDSGTLTLYKRFNDDGTANNWLSGIWKTNAWYASDFDLGYNTIPQYNTGGNAPGSTFPPHIGDNIGLEQLSHAGGSAANVAVAGTWFRKHQFFDLRHSNTYYGYTNWGSTTTALRVIDDYWDNPALTDDSNWDPIGSNMTTTYKAATEDGPVLYTIIGAGGEADPRHRKLQANFNLQGEGVGAAIPAGDNPFSGKLINDFKLRWRANTEFSGTLDTSKLVRTETLVCWNKGITNGLGEGIPTIPQLVSNFESTSLLRWTTTLDETMGGDGGDQTARAWLRSGTGNDGVWAIEYWRMHKIPTWRERTITGIEFQIFRDLEEDDAFDIQYVAVGQTPEPPGNEIDALAFQFLVGSDSQDLYLDGFMLEEVTEDGVYEPSPYAFPNQGTETGALLLGTGIPAQGRAVKLGEKSESANGDMFVTEGDQKVHGGFDEARYYDKALSWNQIEHLFYNPGGRFDKTLSGDWKALNQGTNFYSDTNPVEVTFPTTLGNVGKYLRVGDGDTTTLDDGLHIITNKNIPFDPTIRYKMSANAKDGSASTASNTSIGIIGFSNTGIDLIGTLGEPSWDKLYSIVQSPGGDPAESGSLTSNWTTYKAVYGGNTTHLGTHSTTAYSPLLPASNGHGGNIEQSSAGLGTPKQEFKWANPVRLFGSEAAATQQGTGNTTFIRPVMFINSSRQNDITLIDYIKIEQQRDATLTAEIGTEFKQAGEYLDDSGKIGTSPATRWRPKFIQDDRFYQIYSYVIKSGFSIGTYKELVKKLVHPAGLIMFGQVEIQTFVSAAMRAFDDTLLGDIVDLFRTYYMGAESTLLSEYADVPISGRGVGYHTQFGLDIVGEADFDLDAAHGVTPHGAGKNTPGSPGWIAWDQSPLTSPYANSHYYTPHDTIWPYEDQALGYAPYATSNAYTTVTNDSLIWNIEGWRTLLVSPFENENVGALYAHSLIAPAHQTPDQAGRGQYGWEQASTTYGTVSDDFNIYGITAPLDIDGRAHRYVRMKIRRIGPGGYGADSWLGVCQPTTNPSSGSGGSHWRPTLGLTPTQWNAGMSVPDMPDPPRMDLDARKLFYASANTAQPSTLINSADVLPGTKSPWHILEWDMWELGQTEPTTIDNFIFPDNGGKNMWKDANPTTGASPQDGGTGRRIGAMSFQLCYEPDNKPVGEKFEIAWIQVDDGALWQRGSYAIPVGYANTWTSEINMAGVSLNDTGTGTGGIPYRIRASESTDFSNQTIGDFSVTVAPAATTPSEITRGAPVLYVHSDKSIINAGMIDQISDANGAIFRVSANTANNLDWIVTEVIDSEKFLRTAPGSPALGDYIGGGTPTGNGQFSGPVILDTDVHDNLYVGYVYEDHTGGYPRFGSSTDSKPLMLFRLTPTANVQTDMSESADPHNLRSVGSTSPVVRGRSNTYSAEQILWGNTGGTDGIGVMVGGNDLYGRSESEWAASEIGGGSGSFVDFSTDDLGSLYVVGSGSQNIIKILPAANTSYANGVTRLSHDIVGQVRGRRVFELANPTTLDANNDVLGNWRPTNIISGPKDSLFVACDTGYDPTNRGANSVYCYHVVTEQNIETGEHYTKNVYPVFANTSGLTAWPVTDYVTQTSNVGMSQSCAGMVLDHEEPPNLYYMSANTMYRIKPKGYSYQMGDTEIEQLFPDNYFRDTLNYHGGSSSIYYGYLGFTRHGIGPSDQNSYLYYQNNYQQLQVDSRNRIYFGGMANLFCYSRGSNTELLPLYNQSNTEFSTLQVVVNTAMYTSNINFGYGQITASIDSFVLGAKTANSAFTGGDPGNPSTGANNFSEGVYITMHDGPSYNSDTLEENGRRLIAIYPNANGSFVSDEGGQLAMTIMDENPAANTKYEVDFTGGLNKFRGIGPGKVVLRPEKI